MQVRLRDMNSRFLDPFLRDDDVGRLQANRDVRKLLLLQRVLEPCRCLLLHLLKFGQRCRLQSTAKFRKVLIKYSLTVQAAVTFNSSEFEKFSSSKVNKVQISIKLSSSQSSKSSSVKSSMKFSLSDKC